MIKNIPYLLILLLCILFVAQTTVFGNEVKNLLLFLSQPFVLLVVGFLLTGVFGQRLTGELQS